MKPAKLFCGTEAASESSIELLFSLVSEKGWEKGIVGFINEADECRRKDIESIFSDKLAHAWKFFADLPPNGKILIIESSLVGNGHNFSELNKFIVETAAEYQSAYCTRERNKLAGCNVEICVTEKIDCLPFKESSFDFIAVIGLEKLGRMYKYQCSKWVMLEKLIFDLRKLLKPMGSMYIGVNSASVKMVMKNRCLEMSSWWVERRIKKCGFKIDKVLNFFPSNGNFVAVEDWISNVTPKRKIKNKIVAFFRSETAGYVLGRNGPKNYNKAMFNGIIEKIMEKTDIRKIGLQRIISGSAGSYILDLEGCIIRLPSIASPTSIKRWRNNYETLRSLKNIKLPFSVPEVLLMDQIEKQPFSVESKLNGRSEDTRKKKKQNLVIVEKSVEHLVALLKETGKKSVLSQNEYNRLIGYPLNSLSHHLSEKGIKILKKYEEKLMNALCDQELPLTMTHGDFKTSNFIYDENNQITGIFDWDLSQEYGLPLVDLLLLIGFEESKKRNQSFQNILLNDFICRERDDNRFVKKYINAIGIMDKKKIKCLALMCNIYFFLYHMGPLWRKLKVNRIEIERVLSSAYEADNKKNYN